MIRWKYVCKECTKPLREEDIDFELMVANCPHCGAVFDHKPEDEAPEPDEEDDEEPEPADDAHGGGDIPRGLTFERRGDTTVLTRRWLSFIYVPLALFSLVWDGFMVNWYAMAIMQGAFEMALFGLIHAGVGAGLTYFVLCGFLNTTTVTLGRSALEVRHGPMPWPGNRVLATNELSQLWCKRVRHKNKNSVSYSYTLRAELQSGAEIDLMRGLPDAGIVKWIERFIEDEIGIVDRAMDGEYEH